MVFGIKSKIIPDVRTGEARKLNHVYRNSHLPNNTAQEF